mgnify:CR=1 FL=1
MSLEEFEKEMEKIPFPEHLDDGSASSKLMRMHWSGNPEKLLENLEKALGIKTHVDLSDPEDPVMKFIAPICDTIIELR